LDRSLQSLQSEGLPIRPQRGWIRAVREATGMKGRELARKLGKVPSLVNSLEKSETEYRISLGSLRDAADALGCELVYAFVPKAGTMEDLARSVERDRVSNDINAVEHSMALEDQAVGHVEERIEEAISKKVGRTPRK
jgi:predicted DNA-binding mobile mystery protein A